MWPSRDFQELKRLSLEHIQQIHSATLPEADLAQLELSIWASVISLNERTTTKTSMGLAFHDHPLALLSGVFYADAGRDVVSDGTPTVFADPRGTTPFRYTRMRSEEGEVTLEPTAPFHRLAYAHPRSGLSLVFLSWSTRCSAQHLQAERRRRSEVHEQRAFPYPLWRNLEEAGIPASACRRKVHNAILHRPTQRYLHLLQTVAEDFVRVFRSLNLCRAMLSSRVCVSVPVAG